jgi:fructose-specific phosphotransferase system IIA component
MHISDYIKESTLATDLPAVTREECIERMAELVRDGFGIQDHQRIITSLLDRETVMSTGIGEGIAIPHTTSPEIEEAAISIALVKKGIDFGALDGRPVYLIFLIVGSEKQPNLHLRILARLARLVKHPSFVKNLKKAKTSKDMITAIRDEESKHVI